MTEPDHLFRVGGVEVARYRLDTGDLGPDLGRRPHLHPIRTLSGTVVTDTRPDDHPWHLGLSVAVPDVDGTNFWGGRSYRAADGYQPRDDHGLIAHTTWHDRDAGHADHELHWIGRTGEVLLHERRRIDAVEGEGFWTLVLSTRLRNATGRSIALGSPGSHGRVGAGYGGLFWRLPPGTPEVSGPDRVGEEEVNGSVSPWLAVRGADHTLAFSASDGDPWFVRVADYPGVGTSFAWDTPRLLEPDAALVRTLRVAISDVAVSN